MSGFNLSEAGEKQQGTQYQKVGVYPDVKVTEVVLEKSTVKQVPYLKLITSGANGEVGQSNKMFLSTTVGEGKKTSAWAITARNLVDLIMATHNVDEDTAKGMIVVENENQLLAKVSALLVGRPFRAKFKGEEGSKGNGTIFATLAQVESMKVPSAESRLSFDPTRDIKKYEGPILGSPADAPKKEVDQDALPF